MNQLEVEQVEKLLSMRERIMYMKAVVMANSNEGMFHFAVTVANPKMKWIKRYMSEFK